MRGFGSLIAAALLGAGASGQALAVGSTGTPRPFGAPYGWRTVIVGGYRKRHPVTAAQVQRASIKAKNRAKHRRASRG